MDLSIKDSLFIVGGATSGLGQAVALSLIEEGAKVIANARNEEKLKAFQATYPENVEIVAGDASDLTTGQQIVELVGDRYLTGAVFNAGGPPAMATLDSSIEDWDEAYKTVLRWKVALTKALMPKFLAQGYGRLLYIESMTTKQPVEHLVLSNSLRLAVTGFVKTLSQEVAEQGVTLNILGPGYHSTPRVEQIFERQSKATGKPIEALRANVEQKIPMQKIGDPADFGKLAAWLLSPYSRYISGQSITVDGGFVRGTMG